MHSHVEKLKLAYSIEIAATLLKLKKDDSPITVNDILESLKKEIVENYKVGDDVVQTEREWRLRITEVAKVLGIQLVSIFQVLSFLYYLLCFHINVEKPSTQA